MRQHSTKILLFAKLTAGFAVLTLITAGFSGVKWRQWFPIVFLGETIWTGSLVLIGYFAAEAIKQVEQGLQLFALIFAFILLLVFAWFVPRQLRVKDLLSLEASNEGRSSEQI